MSGEARLSFLGFDAVSTLSEEAKNPKREVLRAILIATLLFILLSPMCRSWGPR